MINRVNSFLHTQTSNAPLIVFRVIFGALAFLGSLRFVAKGWVKELYQDPQYYFTYYGFDWVKPLAGDWMYLPFVIMMLAALGILFGAFYRWSSAFYFLAFTYVEFLDKTNYLNHYYLFSLIAFLLIFLPANRRYSLDVRWKRVETSTTTFPIVILLLQLQLSCVYFFAGLAKLNADWLFRAEPLFTWLQSHRDMPVLGGLFGEKWVAFAFSWFGCLYDLLIVFFLFYRPTRKIAYLFVVVFHLMTSLLFPIGIFPLVMICLTTVFFHPTWHEKLLGKLGDRSPINAKLTASFFPTISKIGIGIYLVMQLIVPFRSLLYPGELFWNEEGFRFSWRVMLMHKEGLATFYVRDPKTNGEIEIVNRKYLTQRQEDQMSTQPDMLIQFAHFLADEFKDTTFVFNHQSYRIQNPTIHADVFVSVNGRPAQKLIDKKVVLSEQKYNLKHRFWLEPYKP